MFNLYLVLLANGVSRCRMLTLSGARRSSSDGSRREAGEFQTGKRTRKASWGETKVTVHATPPSKDPGATAFFSGTYDEAIEMLVQTRDYLTAAGDKDCALLAPERQKVFAFESLRLTSRLTRIMAWLLAQRAVHKGQMSIDEALDEGFCLRNVPVCVEKGADIAGMPEGLRALLERSYRLYVRVSRLDDMVRCERLPALANNLIGSD